MWCQASRDMLVLPEDESEMSMAGAQARSQERSTAQECRSDQWLAIQPDGRRESISTIAVA